MNSEAFRRQLREYLRQAGYQQQDLAERLGFSVGILSRKLNQTDNKALTTSEVKQIIKILAEWQAIGRRSEAVELLTLAGLTESSFTRAEWANPPLDALEQEAAPILATPSTPREPSAPHLLNLPAQLTNFIGRENELAELQALLKKPEVRLLTLHGPGGVGKTRLALQLATQLTGQFPGGLFFVELDNLSDPRLLATVIARTLGLKEKASQPLLDDLKNYLTGQTILLVLDNFEHLVAAGPLINELLVAARDLKVVVTSRAVLQLYGEYEFNVPPLTLPDQRRRPSLAELCEVAAVRLFIQRAGAIRHDFQLTAATAPVVAEICARLDGLPLAIELAAARTRLFSPQAILQRLDHRLKELTNGARDLPPRQQSLRTAIDWSYNLLSTAEQSLFRQLAIFAGGGSLDALEQVCNADHNLPDLPENLLALLNNSLLRREEGTSGEPRFAMLETIREYALERLAEAGEQPELARRHAEYYLSLAETAQPHLNAGPDQLTWLDRLDQEHPNLRAALAWGLHSDPTGELALRLARALYSFWVKRGHLSEGRQWLEQALSHQADNTPQTRQWRAEALLGAGTLAFLQGDLAQARAWHQEGLELRRQLGDRSGLLSALNNAAVVETVEGNREQATRLFEESLAIARSLGDKLRMSASLINLGILAAGQDEQIRAGALYEESLQLLKNTGDRHYTAIALNNLGEIANFQQEYDRALELFEERLAIGRELGDKQGIASALHNIGVVAYGRGEWVQAEKLYREALAVWQEIGYKHGIASVTKNLGAVTARQERYGESGEWLRQSLTLHQALGQRSGVSLCLVGLAFVAAQTGQLLEAARYLGQAAAQREHKEDDRLRDPNFRLLYEETVALLQTWLDGATFEQACQEGRLKPL